MVTGFEGIAVSGHDYLQGCRRISLETLGSDQKVVTITFDESQLELVNDGVRDKLLRTRDVKIKPRKLEKQKLRTGGPHDHTSALDRH